MILRLIPYQDIHWSIILRYTKKEFLLLVIKPLIKLDLIKLFIWWYLFSSRFLRRDQVWFDTYVIYIRFKIFKIFHFFSVTTNYRSIWGSCMFKYNFYVELTHFITETTVIVSAVRSCWYVYTDEIVSIYTH